jgi:hypothetical protein
MSAESNSHENETASLANLIEQWRVKMTEAHDLFATMRAADREEFIKQVRTKEPSMTPALIHFMIKKDPRKWTAGDFKKAGDLIAEAVKSERN